jgi:hypothetical protein
MSERVNFDDPNADLFGRNDEEESEEEQAFKQIYEKNPKRVTAIGDLWYDEMMSEIAGMEIPEEAKHKMIFSMVAGSILDMIADASPTDLALETTFSFDIYMGMALTNKRFKVDLFKEHQKALAGIDREKFSTEEDYENAVVEFEEKWWDIPQPLLEKRTPNDAIMESLSKYGLTE